jgi:hypothetical protein
LNQVDSVHSEERMLTSYNKYKLEKHYGKNKWMNRNLNVWFTYFFVEGCILSTFTRAGDSLVQLGIFFKGIEDSYRTSWCSFNSNLHRNCTELSHHPAEMNEREIYSILLWHQLVNIVAIVELTQTSLF